VLEAARVFPDLAQALEGVALAVALTGRHPAAAPVVDVRDAAAEIAALGRESRAALVFGPETNGLTNDEIGLCGRAATIPADPEQPSYNLSHAVAIAAYEARRAGRRDGGRVRARATHDQKERLLELLEAGLVATDALPRTNRSSYFAEWRALVQRIDLTPKELKLLEHMARKMKRAGSA
jgi:tRNA/rRNA methyltransferase